MQDLFEYSDTINAPFQAFSGNWKVVNPHWHYFTEMLYVEKGILETEVEGKKYILYPGDLIYFHPKEIHSFKDVTYRSNLITREENLKVIQSEAGQSDNLYYAIKFDNITLANTNRRTPWLPRLLSKAGLDKSLQNVFRAEELRHIPIDEYFKNCAEETSKLNFGFDIKVSSMITVILIELIRIWLSKGLDPNASVPIEQFSTKNFSVLEYIDTHSAENISIQELSKKCGMCYSNFAKQFKQQFGRTCKEYIEFIRICKADTLLIYTDKTLDYISQETGFTDASHFIRTYKKIRGITPKQRRINHNSDIRE